MPAPPRQGTSSKTKRRDPRASREPGLLRGRGFGAPLEAAEFKRGPGGRPTREEAERRHGALLATAFRLFLDRGWDGVSVEEISRQSGVAKGFIYARYADKAALFAGALVHLMEAAIGSLHADGPLPEDVEEGLLAFGRKLLGVALRPDALACHRQFIAEAPRFPGLAKLFLERNRVRDTIVEFWRPMWSAASSTSAIPVLRPNISPFWWSACRACWRCWSAAKRPSRRTAACVPAYGCSSTGAAPNDRWGAADADAGPGLRRLNYDRSASRAKIKNMLRLVLLENRVS